MTANLTYKLTAIQFVVTKKLGYEVIERELKKIPNEKVCGIAAENIREIREENKRDFRF